VISIAFAYKKTVVSTVFYVLYAINSR